MHRPTDVRVGFGQVGGQGRRFASQQLLPPVASDAVAEDDEFGIVPGVQGGEGCSTAGGCATCPYMKMNSMDTLQNTIDLIIQNDAILSDYEPKKYTQVINGKSAAELGGEPILFMRHFQKHGSFPSRLVQQITNR